MTALRYHQGNVLHDQVVGSATEHMHILRRPKIGYVQIGACCCKGFDIDGSYRIEDALKYRAGLARPCCRPRVREDAPTVRTMALATTLLAKTWTNLAHRAAARHS